MLYSTYANLKKMYKSFIVKRMLNIVNNNRFFIAFINFMIKFSSNEVTSFTSITPTKKKKVFIKVQKKNNLIWVEGSFFRTKKWKKTKRKKRERKTFQTPSFYHTKDTKMYISVSFKSEGSKKKWMFELLYINVSFYF